MTWRKVGTVARITVGAALLLLGLLWTLQGADLVRIEPVACVGECRPVTGGSWTWLTIGVLTALVGAALLVGRRPAARRILTTLRGHLLRKGA